MDLFSYCIPHRATQIEARTSQHLSSRCTYVNMYLPSVPRSSEQYFLSACVSPIIGNVRPTPVIFLDFIIPVTNATEEMLNYFYRNTWSSKKYNIHLINYPEQQVLAVWSVTLALTPVSFFFIIKHFAVFSPASGSIHLSSHFTLLSFISYASFIFFSPILSLQFYSVLQEFHPIKQHYILMFLFKCNEQSTSDITISLRIFKFLFWLWLTDWLTDVTYGP